MGDSFPVMLNSFLRLKKAVAFKEIVIIPVDLRGEIYFSRNQPSNRTLRVDYLDDGVTSRLY